MRTRAEQEEDRLDALRWLAGRKYRHVYGGEYYAAEVAWLVSNGYAHRRYGSSRYWITDSGRAWLHRSDPK